MLISLINRISFDFQKIYFYSLCILVASIPLGFRLSLYALGFSLLLGLANVIFVEKRLVFNNKISNSLAFLWVIYLLSLLYTSNMNYGIKSTVQLIQLLLIPFLLNFRIPDKNISRLKDIFIVSVIFSLLFFIGRAFINSLVFSSDGLIFNFYNENVPYGSYFYYTELVKPHHPSYYAMYLLLAIVLVFPQKWTELTIQRKVFSIVSITLLILGVFLCSSRAGILSAIIIIFILLFKLIRKSSSYYLSIIILAFTAFALYYLITNPRINTIYRYINSFYQGETEQQTYLESNAMMRLKIWPVLIKDFEGYEIIIGKGIGDTKQDMMECYKREGIMFAFDEKLNAHNQYIQTLYAVGLLGLAVLLYILSYAFWLSFKYRNLVLFLFLVIISVNFMFESVLERGGGVMFFIFFIVLFTEKHIERRSSSFKSLSKTHILK